MSVCLFWHDIPNWLFIHVFFFIYVWRMIIIHFYHHKKIWQEKVEYTLDFICEAAMAAVAATTREKIKHNFHWRFARESIETRNSHSERSCNIFFSSSFTLSCYVFYWDKNCYCNESKNCFIAISFANRYATNIKLVGRSTIDDYVNSEYQK